MKFVLTATTPDQLAWLKDIVDNLSGSNDALKPELCENLEQLKQLLQSEDTRSLVFWETRTLDLAGKMHLGEDPNQALTEWAAVHQVLPEICIKSRSQVCLVNIEEALASTEGLQRLLIEQFAQSADIARSVTPVASHADSLAYLVAERIVSDYKIGADLELELQALSNPVKVTGESRVLSTQTLMESLYQLHVDHPAEIGQRIKLEEELETLRTRLTLAEAENNQLRESEAANLQRIQEKMQRLDEVVTEKDLLALQLHQLQEEAEQVFFKLKNEENKFKGADQLLAEQTTENELIFLQLHQLQEETEQKALQLKESELRGSEQKIRLDEQLNNYNLLEQRLSESQQEAEFKYLEAAQLKQRLEDQTTENELMLLQLHQVQEELEHYFLLYKESEMQFKELNTFRKNLALTHPQYCSAENITLLGGMLEGDYQNLNCMIEELEHFDTSWSRVNVKVLQHLDQPGIELRASSDDLQMPLPGYIETGRDDSSGYMVILPGMDDAETPIAQLSSTDLLRLRGIVELLRGRIRSGFCERTERTRELDTSPWLMALDKLAILFEQAGKGIRFGEASLVECYRTDGYEHLWLKLDNVSLEGRILPELDFKLAAKGVEANEFTDFGALEFRDQESGLAPFTAWPPVQEDEYGPVLTLDFPSGLDAGLKSTWQFLSVNDQQVIDALLKNLPSILVSLDSRGEDLGRSAEAWCRLTNIMTERLIEVSSAK